MAGSREGGLQAATTNKKRYGEDFYANIGRKGGKISRGGGFAMSHELASAAGRKGGKASRRLKNGSKSKSDFKVVPRSFPAPIVMHEQYQTFYKCRECISDRFKTLQGYQQHYSVEHE